MAYRLTRKAASDLRHVYVEGIRLFGIEQAARYHARLGQAFELLGDNPKLARERLEISPAGSHPSVRLARHRLRLRRC